MVILLPNRIEIGRSDDDDGNERYNKRTINGLDARDMIKELNLNFNEGNILKYLLRDKNQDIQDLEKIINYAQHEIEYLKKQKEQPKRNENGVIDAVVW